MKKKKKKFYKKNRKYFIILFLGILIISLFSYFVLHNSAEAGSFSISGLVSKIVKAQTNDKASGEVNSEGFEFKIDDKLEKVWDENPLSTQRVIVKYKKNNNQFSEEYLGALRTQLDSQKEINPADFDIEELNKHKIELEKKINGIITNAENSKPSFITGYITNEVSESFSVEKNSSIDALHSELLNVEERLAVAEIYNALGVWDSLTYNRDVQIEVLNMDFKKLELLKLNNLIDKVYIDEPVEILVFESMNITRVNDAVSLGFNGEDVSICVLDTGINFDFVPNAVNGYDFVNGDDDASDDNGHGTSVAYVIYNVAPASKIISVKVMDANGTGYESTIISGLQYCHEQDVSIISMSIGSGGYNGYCDDNPVAQLVNELNAKGILIVAATGNDGSEYVKVPACASGALAVGASAKNDTFADFTSFNGNTLLLAPGKNINTIDKDGNAKVASGTSMSVPFVSGISAMLKQSDEDLISANLKDRIIHTGQLIEAVNKTFSRVDAYNAIVNNITNNLIASGVDGIGNDTEYTPQSWECSYWTGEYACNDNPSSYCYWIDSTSSEYDCGIACEYDHAECCSAIYYYGSYDCYACYYPYADGYYYMGDYDYSFAMCEDVCDDYELYRQEYSDDGSNHFSWNTDAADNACCTGSTMCVYSGTCYTDGTVQDLNSDGRADARCYSGQWINVDYADGYCSQAGGNWATLYGDADADHPNYYTAVKAAWHTTPGYCGYMHFYGNGDTSKPCCCGDDAGEYYRTYSIYSACCNVATDCVDYDYNTCISSGSKGNAGMTGPTDYCYLGTWYDCNDNTDCGTCKKCSSGTCINQADNEDLKSECSGPSFTTCSGSCARYGPDGYCDGAGACDTNDYTGNIASYKVCSGSGSETNATISTSCDGSYDYWDMSYSTYCQYETRYAECNGAGSCDTNSAIYYEAGEKTNVPAYKTVITPAQGGTTLPYADASSYHTCNFNNNNYYAVAGACTYNVRYAECNGADVCDTSVGTYYQDGGSGNIASYKVATGQSWSSTYLLEQDATTEGLACDANTNNYCTEGQCSGTQRRSECNAGSCDTSATTYYDYTNIYATQGYTLTSACGVTGTTICGSYSAYNQCSGQTRGRDIYMCSTAHTCSYDAGANAWDGGNCGGNCDSYCITGVCENTAEGADPYGICSGGYTCTSQQITNGDECGSSTACGHLETTCSGTCNNFCIAGYSTCQVDPGGGYTGGNWNVLCSDNCVITANVNLGHNNLNLFGSGTFTLNANIENWNRIVIPNSCRIIIKGNSKFF